MLVLLFSQLGMAAEPAGLPPDPAAACKEAPARPGEKAWYCGAAEVRLVETSLDGRSAAEGAVRVEVTARLGQMYRSSRGRVTIEGQDMPFELYVREGGAPLTVFNVSGEPAPGVARTVSCATPEKGQAAVDDCSTLSVILMRDGKF